MSNWVALNIEPDEAIEEEVDDTKEIQIEEALKLYQNALKLHSQGPQFYPQAAEAYDALLNSEIFKYPESISDYKRSTLQESESQLLSDAAAAAASAAPAADTLGEFDVNDSTSSTLMQTIYLSYKNHGQYLLDSLQAFLQDIEKGSNASQESTTKVAECSSAALASFADALERDDTDLNLWRQSARLSSALQSYRLVRYCLESVLADDENRLEVRAEQLGLEETFAEDRLRDALQSLHDRLSISQIPLKKPRKALLNFLKKQTDPYPYLPALPHNLEDVDSSKKSFAMSTPPRAIKPSAVTWLAVGKAILEAIVEEENSAVHITPGTSVNIILPATGTESATATAKGTHRRQESSKTHNSKYPSIEKKDDKGTEDKKPSTAVQSPPVVTKTEEPDSAAAYVDDKSSIDQGAERQLMDSLEGQSSQQPEATNEPETVNGDELDPKSSATAGRKRSSASAANDDNAEGLRAKSRRTRARESHVETLVPTDEVAFDQTKYYEDRLEDFFHADAWLFGTVGSLLVKVGVEDLGTIEDLKALCPIKERKNSTDSNAISATSVEAVLFQDLRTLVSSWDEGKTQAMIQSDNFSTLQDLQGMSKSGLAIFLEHSRKSARKSGIDKILSGGEELLEFQKFVNAGWFHVHEVAFRWLECLLTSEYGKHSQEKSALDETSWPAVRSAYISFQWPDALKETVVQILLRDDEYIYKRMCEQVADLEYQVLDRDSVNPFKYTQGNYSDLEMIQTIFELHLDIYALINNPSSEIDQATRVLQWDRLERWSVLARTSLNHFIDHGSATECPNNFALRHLWASTFHSNTSTDVQREHVLLCLQDLKHVLSRLGNPEITLKNNAIMPELSAGAIDQEISKLNSMDFFLRIFSPDSENPVDLIETIEPILEPSSVEYVNENTSEEEVSARPESQVHEMSSFLDRGDATLRLFLWRRLLDAYKQIDYPPKVVSCYLRIIETIVKELWNASHLEEPAEHRQTALLRWLKSVEGILSKVVTLILNGSDKAYDCFDMDHLKSSMSAVARLSKLLHSFALFEDSVRVGQLPGPDVRGSLGRSLEGFKDKLREMQVRCWILQYTLLKEAIAQNTELFDTPIEDRIHYLRSVHNVLGVRSMCKRSQKQFPKLMKSELLNLEIKEDYELDISQVLYDLHGIKLTTLDGVVDHGCPTEKIDRPTAIMMIDLVMKQAKKISIKDLSKSDLKTTIDKMQSAIGNTKSSPPLSYNKRILSTYLKSPINPSSLYRAVRGVEDLPLIPVPTESAIIARNGWFFLLGHAALTKFRSQKRLFPIPTTDLDEAITYFRQDLEHGTGRWEAWYRLAQTYDTKLEEDLTWSADKINNNQSELATWQRNAIHCYAMAISTAIREAEPTPETRELLSEVYTDFGIRMYSSSRDPLSMGAFSLTDFTKHFSKEESQEMYKGQPFREMKLYSVWNFASYLLKRAIVDKPKSWMTHYMLSKCLWKMFNCDESVRGNSKRISIDDLLDSLLDAIDTLPQRKDSRSEPIFEPHFKLVSIIHKLVDRDILTPAEASKTLVATPWARKVQPPEDKAGWKAYILEILRRLKSGDKANWHHRMASRSAHVIYDDQKDATAAASAKNELTQQIFTKTMTIQVWRPEYERPGRHFVYTTQYAYFFVGLLDQLDDRANLDQLLRRVRKKQGDFINHTKLWEDICLTYAKVIRRAGSITEGHEEGVFRPIGWEEFVANTARLENLPELVPQSSVLLELLRDAVELKKLNNNLMKVSLLEDLIADLYSRLYEINTPQLLELANEENKEKMKVDHLLMASDGAADTPTPPASAPPSEAPAPRGRTKGIARRDIQKRAETIVTRKLPVRAPGTKTAAPADGEPSQPSTGAELCASHPGKESLREEDNEDPNSGQQSDIPNSLHDSADDESELSEIDDEKLSKLAAERKALLFPNLHGSQSPEPGSGMSIDGDEGEGDVEGQGEDDREGDADLGEGEGEGETMMEEEGEEGEGDDDIEGDEGDDMDEEGEQEGQEEGDEEVDGDLEMEDFKATDGGEGEEESEHPETSGEQMQS